METPLTPSTVASVRTELEQEHKRILKWQEELAAFDKRFETHPGGWEAGAFDLMAEEVLILLEMKAINPNAKQIGGEHYRENNDKVQHWDIVHFYNMNYFIGNMTKYVCRWRKKGGLKDLEKALHYLEKFQVLRTEHGRALESVEREPSIELWNFCRDQKLSSAEKYILGQAVLYRWCSDEESRTRLLEDIRQCLLELHRCLLDLEAKGT